MTLRRGMTVADELGKCNDRDREMIAGSRLAKKSFRLEAVGNRAAKLCPYMECDQVGGRLRITVNLYELEHEWVSDRPYWTDRWTPLEIPAGILEQGLNEVVFQSLDDSTWTLLIESSRQPDLSEVSEDGGVTWRAEDLGWNNGCDGEYMVRLWLDQHSPAGYIESEVIDRFLDRERGIGVPTSSTISFAPEFILPEGSRGTFRVRSGNSPAYTPTEWCPWSDPEVFEPGNHRFVQWRADLASEEADTTPTLLAVTCSIQGQTKPRSRVTVRTQPPLSYSSYRFAHASHDDARSARLRERWGLDEVVRGAKTEFEAYLMLRQWVRDQWEDGWDMGALDFCPPWDAMLILELASQKLSLGMCTHYSTVMSQCSAALGLNARTQIMRCHCVNEVWSTDHQKWVVMDVGGDNDDETKFVYHFEKNGVPMSARECHEAWVEGDYDDVAISPQPPAATKGRYEVPERLKLFDRFLISLRNDELRSLEPGESEHGKGSYHYDGYLFWEDQQTEPLPWFSNHTSRAEDLYWSVNQTYIHLLELVDGDLSVLLETATPNLSHFERRVGGRDWERCDAAFGWDPSKDGELEVRSVSRHGKVGVTSTVRVDPND